MGLLFHNINNIKLKFFFNKIWQNLFKIKLNGQQITYGTFTYSVNGGRSTSTLTNGDSLDNNALIGDTTTRITYCQEYVPNHHEEIDW